VAIAENLDHFSRSRSSPCPGTWIFRATLFLDSGGVIAHFGNMQEIIFLEIALTENWLIFITRLTLEGGITLPSFQLVGAVLGVHVLATLFALFGWLSGDAPHAGWVDVVTVIRIWCYSFGVTVIVALVYFILSKWSWLDNLGRKNRHVKNSPMEDMLTSLQRLTIVHAKGDSDERMDTYTLQNRLEIEGH